VDNPLPKLVTQLREKPALLNNYLVVVCDETDSSHRSKVMQTAERLSVVLPALTGLDGSNMRIASSPSEAAKKTALDFANIFSGEWAAFRFPSTNIATSTDKCLEKPIATYRKDTEDIAKFLSGLAELILELEKKPQSFTVILVNPEVARALKFITSFKSMREYFQATVPSRSGETFLLERSSR